MRTIRTVGIVGAGTMGTGIATNLAQHGIAVRLLDARPEAALAAIASARGFFGRAVERGRMDAAAAEASAGRLKPADRLEDLAGSDLVIEAVFEDFALKAELFGRLGRALPLDTLVATNTSCLRVSELARHLEAPGRFLGLHYFSPAQINPIVEVVRGEASEPATVEAGLAFCRATGKQPIICRDSYGFAINRFFCPYTNEACRLVDEGFATAEIDLVAEEAVGAAAGPFRVQNLIKPRINLHAIRNLAPLGPFYAPAASLVRVGEADRPWEIGEDGPPTPERRALIRDRLRLGVFLPVLQELDEQVASPADIDLGAREALRFAKPPCALMDELGRAEVERIVAPALARFGLGRPAALDRVGRLLG
jgi:3-hydroxybutyryl-CoA dehydrogenase